MHINFSRFIAFSGFLFFFLVKHTYAVTTWDTGLVAHISFNEGAGNFSEDISGRGHTANLQSTADWGDSARNGKALLLDGSSAGYAVVKNTSNDELNTKHLTVSAWINPSSFNVNEDYAYIVSKGRDTGTTNLGGYGMRLFRSNGKVYLRAEVWVENSLKTDAIGEIEIEFNTWTHIALAYDGGSVKTYINGDPDATEPVTQSGEIEKSSLDFVIGALAFSTQSYHFNGMIDEVRVYNRALSLEEIEAMYTAPANDPKLVFYESFDTLDSIESNSGKAVADVPLEDVVNLSDGKMGKALQIINITEWLKFPMPSTFKKNKGAISFWFQPADSFFTVPNQNDTKPRIMLLFESDPAGSAYFSRIQVSNEMAALTNLIYSNTDLEGGDVNGAQSTNSNDTEPGKNPISQWETGQWYHIVANWDFTSSKEFLQLEIDGQLFNPRLNQWDTTSIDPISIIVGSDKFNPAMGAIDELRIYSEPIYDINKPVESYKRLVRGDGKKQSHETINNSPADTSTLASNEVFVFFETSPFEAVMLNTVPEAAQIKNEITYKAAMTEGVNDKDINYESLFFNIYSLQGLDDVTISFTDFQNAQGDKISKANAKLRIAHNWWQAGKVFRHDRTPIFVPELLLADDRVLVDRVLQDQTIIAVPLDGTSCSIGVEECDHNTLPTFPMPSNADDVETNLIEHTSKQFVLTVPIDATILPGNYTSTVSVKWALGQKDLDLIIVVEDIALKQSGRDFIMFNRGDYKNPTAIGKDIADYISENRYDKQLDDIRAHGFNGVTIYARYDGDLDYLGKVINSGFTGPVIYQVQLDPSATVNVLQECPTDSSKTKLKCITDAMKGYNLDPWVSAADEPDGSGKDADALAKFLTNIENIHTQGGFAYAGLTKLKTANNINTFQGAGTECGQPTYDKATEKGYFIWKDCQANTWHVRVTGGGDSSGLVYTGAFESTDDILGHEVSPFLFSGSDEINFNQDGSMSYVMNVWNSGVDGIDFTATKPNMCFRSDDPSFTVHLGSGKQVIPTPINLEMLNNYGPLEWTNLGAHDLTKNKSTVAYLKDIVENPQNKKNFKHSTYWQLASEDPRINRYRTGYFMWVTGLDGAAPYVYQDISGNPYNDFDQWRGSDIKDDFLAYPSNRGPIGTIQWEAMREGIDDLRYLATWSHWYDYAMSHNRLTEAASSKIEIDKAMEKYKDFEAQSIQPIAQFNVDREIIAAEILILKKLFGGTGTECGQPTYDKATEKGYFIWKDCQDDTWHLRVTGGGDSSGLVYSGTFESAYCSGNQDVEPFLFSGDDQIICNPDPDGSMSYVMNVWSSGEDGIDFTASKPNMCFRSDDPSFTVYLGSGKQVIMAPINLDTLQSCGTPPPPTNCGMPSIDSGSDHGQFIWKDCTSGDWSIQASAGFVNGLHKGKVTSSSGFSQLPNEISFEGTNDFITQLGDGFEYQMGVGNAGIDQIDFFPTNEADTCFDGTLSNKPIYFGPDKIDVSNRKFNLSTLVDC